MNTLQTVALAATVALVPLAASTSGAAAADKKAVLTTYADIAHAAYQDSLTTAEALRQAVEKLLADPSEDTLAAAREAWIDSSEEHTSELQSLMRISYAVFCLKKKK